MTRTLLVLVAGIIAGLCGINYKLQAQTDCLSYETFLTKKTALDSAYRRLQETLDPNHKARPNPVNGVSFFSDMSRQERKVRLIQSDFQAKLNQHLLTLGLLLTKVKGVEIFAFVNSRGSIDYVAYNLDKHTLNEFEQEQIQHSLCSFFSTYTFKQGVERPYQVYCSFRLMGSTLTDIQAQLNRFIPNHSPSQGAIRSVEELTTTQPDTVTTITLEQIELAKVPRALLRFKNVQHLNLNDNELTQIPRFIFRLKKLTTLNVSGNRLTNSAIHCKRNKHLKRINLQFNRLTNLPKRLPKNNQLESLWIGYNDLSTGLNPRILSRLKHLKDLNFYRAKLTSLPTTIGRLAELETLDLYYNQLRELPAQIGTNRSLQQLALSYNLLGSLPIELAQLDHLTALYVRNNSLTSLPIHIDALKSLQILDLSDNAFEELPSSLINLSISSLQELNISQNRLTSFPIQFFKSTRLKLLDIGANPATSKGNLKVLMPLIRELEARQTQVRY